MTTTLKAYQLNLLKALSDEIGEGDFALESAFVIHQVSRPSYTRKFLRELRANGLVRREYCGWLCDEGCPYREDYEGPVVTGEERHNSGLPLKHLSGCGKDAELFITDLGRAALEQHLPFVLQRVSSTTGEVLGSVGYDNSTDPLVVMGYEDDDLPEELQGVGYLAVFNRRNDGLYAITPAIEAQRRADGLR